MREIPLVSIIIPTLHRVEQVQAMLTSIRGQRYANYEIIVVDQNCSDLLDDSIRAEAANGPITHLKCPPRGASHARNVGAAKAVGQVLCFPDDDAEFYPETIERALAAMAVQQASTVFGKVVDRDQRDSVMTFKSEPGFLSLTEHQGMFVEATMFIARDTFLAYGYDETFGVGTFYGAEEAYDLVLRMLKAGERLYYSPDIVYYHPSKITDHGSPAEIKRVYTYRCGFAHLCLKHGLRRQLLIRLVKVTLYIGYLSVFKRAKVRYYMAEWLGIVTGMVVR